MSCCTFGAATDETVIVAVPFPTAVTVQPVPPGAAVLLTVATAVLDDAQMTFVDVPAGAPGASCTVETTACVPPTFSPIVVGETVTPVTSDAADATVMTELARTFVFAFAVAVMTACVPGVAVAATATVAVLLA